jgi:aminoglycoside 6'-N-acetyltransferase
VTVTFTPVTEEHRALLESWLWQPHWREWWGEPEEELRLIYAVEDGEHEPYLACLSDEPVAYVQAWWPSQHPDLEWQHGMPMTTRGIDISIGDAEDLGKGLGPLILKHFAAKLFAEGATRLVIDPDLRNERAIAAYLKAGFTPYGEADGSLLMELLLEETEWLSNAI